MASAEDERRRLREFFAARAVGWEQRYPDDTPAYRAAVTALELGAGDRVLDAGCGTGRALPLLRDAVGPSGVVVGVDLTPEMLDEAKALGRSGAGALLEGDSSRLPLRDEVVDAVLAAGLLRHLADAEAGLRELARVTVPGGRLAVFHPVGRAVLAARRGHTLRPDDIRAAPQIGRVLDATGWDLRLLDDAQERYLALAVRR